MVLQRKRSQGHVGHMINTFILPIHVIWIFYKPELKSKECFAIKLKIEPDHCKML